MASVDIPDGLLDILKDFGDTHDLTRTAVRRYVVELTTRKMEEFKNAIEAMEAKYGCDYKSFITMSVNKDFREKVLKKQNEWKRDLLDWEKNTENLSMWVERVAQLIHDF